MKQFEYMEPKEKSKEELKELLDKLERTCLLIIVEIRNFKDMHGMEKTNYDV